MDDTKQCADLLGFLDGGTPPVFEDYGAEALLAGTVTAEDGPNGPVTYEAPDAGIYNLTTRQGRTAWKAHAPEGVRRTIPEDGGPWLDSVLDTVTEAVSAWLRDRGIDA